MEKRFKVEFTPFEYVFIIIYTDNLETSRNKDNDILGIFKGNLSCVDGMHCHNPDYPDSYIYITPTSSVGTISHEVFHGVWRMMEWIGAQLDNEIVAYNLGYGVDQVLKFKNRIDGKKSRKRRKK